MTSPRPLIFAALAGCAVLFLADRAYFTPRYGGLLGYATGGSLAASEAESLEGELGSLRSALSIYYGDHGNYPETLDALWKDKKYLQGPPRRANIFVPARGNAFERAHWYRDASKIKNFPSLDAVDDAGGWGYVNDPKSPDFGTVFIDCTHVNFHKGIPWNQLGRSAPAAAASAAEPSPQRAPAPPAAATREGFRGWVLALGVPVAGAELAFTSTRGARTVTTASGADGRYEVDLPAGRYRVTVTHPKYQTYSTGKGFFVVLPGVRGTGNILMRPL